MASIDRPEFCATCGCSIGLSAPIVRNGKGPWTCETCDGFTKEQLEQRAAKRQETMGGE